MIAGVLDPGHGGPDPGCTTPDGFSEAAWALELGQSVVTRTKEIWPDLDLRLTRDADHDPTHRDRAAFALACGGFAIALHVDSNPDAAERGPLAFRLKGVGVDSIAGRMCHSAMAMLAHRGGVYADGGRVYVTTRHCHETSDYVGDKALGIPPHWRHRAHYCLAPYAHYGIERQACLIEFGRCSNAGELAWIRSAQGKEECLVATLAAIAAAVEIDAE